MDKISDNQPADVLTGISLIIKSFHRVLTHTHALMQIIRLSPVGFSLKYLSFVWLSGELVDIEVEEEWNDFTVEFGET